MLSDISTTKYRIILKDDGKADLEWWNPKLEEGKGRWQEFLFYDSLDDIRKLSVHLKDLLDAIDRGNLE